MNLQLTRDSHFWQRGYSCNFKFARNLCMNLSSINHPFFTCHVVVRIDVLIAYSYDGNKDFAESNCKTKKQNEKDFKLSNIFCHILVGLKDCQNI